MKNDLKKKFLDILFEPEEDVVEESEITEVRGLKTNTTKETKTIKASELIYGQKETKPLIQKEVKSSNSFINLDIKETKKEEPKPEVKADLSDTYELKHHISPIFGNIENKKAKKEEIVKKPAVSQNAINPKEYTGIVLSPIFGYDNTSADKARVDFMKNKKKDSALLTSETSYGHEVKEVKPYEETISLFDEPFDEPIVKDEVFEEPFTTEIKVIDIEGEPIEEVEEEYDEPEEIKSFELEDLDDLNAFADEKYVEDVKKELLEEDEKQVKLDIDSISSTNSKSFIDDLLGDKD